MYFDDIQLGMTVEIPPAVIKNAGLRPSLQPHSPAHRRGICKDYSLRPADAVLFLRPRRSSTPSAVISTTLAALFLQEHLDIFSRFGYNNGI